jgi:hypothetical protein
VLAWLRRHGYGSELEIESSYTPEQVSLLFFLGRKDQVEAEERQARALGHILLSAFKGAD